MNQILVAGEAIQSSRAKTSRRRVRAILLLLVCAGGLWFFIPNSALHPEVTILPPDYSIPAPPLPLPDRWIPTKWGWLWRLRYAVLGKPVVVDIETKVVRVGTTGETLLLELLKGRGPLTSSNGVRGWILPEAELKEIGQRIAQERDCSFIVGRMSLGAGILATMSMTTAPQVTGSPVLAGNTWNCAVQPYGAFVELTGAYNSLEIATNAAARSSGMEDVISLRTNLALAAMMRVPRGHGAFLYDTNRVDARRSGVGLLIQPAMK